MIKTVFDLEVFNLSYRLAMEVFHFTRNFPKEERYTLTDQIVRPHGPYQPIFRKDGGNGYMKMNSKSTSFMLWVYENWRTI